MPFVEMTTNGKADDSDFFSLVDKKPIVTYAGDKDLFLSLEATVIQSLPQEATEWRRSYGRAIKSIQISGKFIPFSEDKLPVDGDWNIIDQPVFHTYWTQCTELEYKQKFRYDIEKWMKKLTERNISDWLIILVETYDFRKHNKLLPRTTVLDKIRNDLGSKNADRCLSVINPLRSELRSGGSWRGLMINFRLLLLATYDKILLRLEDFIRFQRERRSEAGWNFCKYFLLQEELAFVLEMLGVYEEALVQYDELDALFTQFILNSNLGDIPSWLTNFQVPINSWQGIEIHPHSINLRLRALIQRSQCSLLDFRSYLFSRQAAILLLTLRPWELAQRTLGFLHNCLNELNILEIPRSPGSVACWVFLCCLEVLHTCDKFQDTSQVEACSQYTAGLWAYTRDKLYELAELCGLLPETETTSKHLHTVVMLTAGMGDSDSVPIVKLKEALSSKEAFRTQYLELSELALGRYKYIGRLRFARQIERSLAAFFERSGDIRMSAKFLSNSLDSFEDDNWSLLTLNTMYKLIEYYKQLGEYEKIVKLCSIISSSRNELEDEQSRIKVFQDMISVLEAQSSNNNTSQPRWKLLLERSFSVESIDVNILSKQLSCELVLKIHSKFPVDIETEEIQISIDGVSPSKKESLHSRRYCEKKYRKNSRPFPQKLPMSEQMDFQEDKTLASVNIVCENDKYWMDTMRRQDSQQKLTKTAIPTRGNYTKKFSCTNVTLKPGENTVILKSNMYKTGIYRISQLSIETHKRLEFLSNAFQPKVLFEIKECMASVTVTPLSELVAGIQIPIEIKIDTGSSSLPKGSKLVLSSSPGLSFLLDEEDSPHPPLETQVTLSLSEDHLEAFSTSILRLIMIAELPHQKDNTKIDHSMWIKCPWSEEQNHVKFAFELPFACSCKLQTVNLRKFLQVNIQGYTRFNISLLSANLTCSETLKPVNVLFPISICENKTASLVWELLLNNAQEDTIKYSLDKYSVEDNKENENHPLNDIVKLSPSKSLKKRTLYIVETRIESLKGASDFCRVSTMCHLIIDIIKLFSSPVEYCLTYEVLADQTLWAVCGSNADIIKLFSSPVEYCLTYEVLADQTLWAVCGSNADHIAMDETTKKASISLDVMPLVNGHLPIPVVKISKYFPPSKGFRGQRTQARSEVFSPGEVYNKSKASQVHVIVPSANNEL
ncbi:hypothetical protein M8J75_000144 [Diaphorina citri]|nr:hypothetical protein M8J75_000144 [Diaphorina citri]